MQALPRRYIACTFKSTHSREQTLTALMMDGGSLKLTHRMQGITQKTLEHMRSRQTREGDIADLLMRIKSGDSGSPLPDYLLFPEVAALFFTGSDTTAHAATFIL